MLARGSAAKQVAHELGCSASTIHNHLHHIYRKLDVTGQSQALLLGAGEGLGLARGPPGRLAVA